MTAPIVLFSIFYIFNSPLKMEIYTFCRSGRATVVFTKLQTFFGEK